MNFKQKIFLLIALLQAPFSYSADWNKLNFTDKQTNAAIATTTLATIGYISYHYAQQTAIPTVIIDVKDLTTEKGNFPANFAWGAATASTQNEEISGNNTWSPEYLKTMPGKENLPNPGFACKSWSQWQDDIDKLEYLGVNSYRLSIEWSRIEPSAGQFDQAAIDHYVQICKKLVEKNITPMVCLHHYSDPIWFMEQGGFTQEENIAKFQDFCTTMYKALNPYVAQWIVISQPAAYAMKGYKVAMQPPFLNNSGLETQVMLNLFKAHIQVYDAMHNSYNTTQKGKKPEVGLCHQMGEMKAVDTYNLENGYGSLSKIAAYFANRLYHETLLRTFTDGHIQTLIPGKDVAYLPQAPQKFDFFALSYYSPSEFDGMKRVPSTGSPALQTADVFRKIDKKGMYLAIKRVAELGKPIYVAECGIFPKNEDQRILHANSYLSAISQAIHDGYDVRGFEYWTLMDNYEWSANNGSSSFGLYENRVQDHTTGQLNPVYKNHEQMLKKGGKHYKNIIKKQTKSIDEHI